MRAAGSVDNVAYRMDDTGGFLRLHIYGSGSLMMPLQHNDWLRTNFAICPVAGVHFGFLVAAMKLARKLRAELREYDRVLIQGHSLGGAVAEVLGAMVARNSQTEVKVRNFGGPAPWRRFKLIRAIRGAQPTDMVWYHAGADVVPFAMPWNTHRGRRKWIPYRPIFHVLKAHGYGYGKLNEDPW